MPDESASRGVDDNPARNEWLTDELAVMINRWGELLYVDPASNPNLDFDGYNFGHAGRPIVTPWWLIS